MSKSTLSKTFIFRPVIANLRPSRLNSDSYKNSFRPKADSLYTFVCYNLNLCKTFHCRNLNHALRDPDSVAPPPHKALSSSKADAAAWHRPHM